MMGHICTIVSMRTIILEITSGEVFLLEHYLHHRISFGNNYDDRFIGNAFNQFTHPISSSQLLVEFAHQICASNLHPISSSNLIIHINNSRDVNRKAVPFLWQLVFKLIFFNFRQGNYIRITKCQLN